MRNRNVPLLFLFGLLTLALLFPFVHWGRSLLSSPPPEERAGETQTARTDDRREQDEKRNILQKDVAMTEALSREQCRKAALGLAGRIETGGNQNPVKIRSLLRETRREQPHMHALAWVPGADRSAAPIVREGDIHANATNAGLEWNRAVRSAAKGAAYESGPIIGNDGERYFVFSQPSAAAEPKGGLVALVHQDVLRLVARHQEKNLRLRPFPDENRRFGIHAVDPQTGRQTDVDSAEENEGMSHYKQQQVVVRFRNEPDGNEMERIRKDIRAAAVIKSGRTYIFESETMSTAQLIDYFSRRGVVYAEPHFMYVTNDGTAAEVVPNDELYAPYQWNLPVIEAPAGWALAKGSEQVIVAVIDTGAALHHPDLAAHLTEGYNAIDPSAPPEDDVGHGTHVAGVVSALTDNGEGVAGLTWYNKVMPVKALDDAGMGSTYSVAEGILWATDHGAKVINLSLGNYASAQFLHDAVRYAFDRDVVLIAATGNDNTGQPGYPAAYPEVFAVSATDQYGHRAPFSNYGDYVDVVAPGENIASTYLYNQYAALSGTSMASPHVAALAALIRSADPELHNTDVYDIMRRSTVDLGEAGKDDYFGYGQISVARALRLATGQQPEAASEGSPSGRPTMLPPGALLEKWIRILLGGG